MTVTFSFSQLLLSLINLYVIFVRTNEIESEHNHSCSHFHIHERTRQWGMTLFVMGRRFQNDEKFQSLFEETLQSIDRFPSQHGCGSGFEWARKIWEDVWTGQSNLTIYWEAQVKKVIGDIRPFISKPFREKHYRKVSSRWVEDLTPYQQASFWFVIRPWGDSILRRVRSNGHRKSQKSDFNVLTWWKRKNVCTTEKAFSDLSLDKWWVSASEDHNTISQ
jgi:hypothetical protein